MCDAAVMKLLQSLVAVQPVGSGIPSFVFAAKDDLNGINLREEKVGGKRFESVAKTRRDDSVRARVLVR